MPPDESDTHLNPNPFCPKGFDNVQFGRIRASMEDVQNKDDQEDLSCSIAFVVKDGEATQ